MDQKFLKWRNHPRAVIIGNGPSLSKINLHVFDQELTIGVNGILYNGFEPTFICITDHIIVDTHPAEILFGSKKSIYLFRHDLYQKYQDKIHRYLSPQQIHTLKCNTKIDMMHQSVTQFDPSFKNFNVSYSVMMDIVFPLVQYLKISVVYMLGIDHNNFKKHSYDTLLTSKPIDPPNPQNLSNFNDQTQADDLTRRYQKAKTMLEKYGIRVWNIGLDSKLEVFLKANLTDIFPNAIKNLSKISTSTSKNLEENEKQIFYWTIHRYDYPFRYIPSNQKKEGYFQSLLAPKYRLRHKKGIATLEKIPQNYNQDPLYQKDTTFVLEHGIASEKDENYATHSFRAHNKPNFYLQKENSVTLIRPYRQLVPDKTNQIALTKNELSEHWVIDLAYLGRFIVFPERSEERKQYVRCCSLENPNCYLRHSYGKLRIDPYSDTKQYLHDSIFILVSDQNDNQKVYLKDITYQPDNPPSFFFKCSNNKLYFAKNKKQWIISPNRELLTLSLFYFQ